MLVVTAEIGREIRIDLHDLEARIRHAITDALTVRNGARAKAIKLGQWGAEDMPEFFDLWRLDVERRELVLPRGFATALVAGLAEEDIEVRWKDITSCPERWMSSFGIKAPTLRPEQERAVEEFLVHRQGNLQAPTGSGKTVAALEAWRRSDTSGIVLVQRKDLLKQWQARAREHLEIETGIIGDGEWREGELTISMLQTLHRRPSEGRELLERVGMTILDESHHAPADTYREIISWCWSRYFLGMTATPLDGEWTKPFLEALIGPVFHIVDRDSVAERVQPTVRVVKTDFLWTPQTKEEARLVDSRAIYKRIIAALQKDEDRLRLIAQTICDQPAQACQLVTCARLGYIDDLAEWIQRLGYEGDVYEMTGRKDSTHRELVAKLADNGHCVILATVADEGVDIPRLDRLHLAWPGRLPRTFVQKGGRLTRLHAEKLDPVIYDYNDHLQGVMLSQFRTRLHQVYIPQGWSVEYERGVAA